LYYKNVADKYKFFNDISFVSTDSISEELFRITVFPEEKDLLFKNKNDEEKENSFFIKFTSFLLLLLLFYFI
jgi:hypothetical protein